MGKFSISQQDWIRIGKTAGWFTKRAYHSDTIQAALDKWRKSNKELQDAINLLFSVKHLLEGGQRVDPGLVLQVDKIIDMWEKNPSNVLGYASNMAVQLGYGEKSPYDPIPSEAVKQMQTDVMREHQYTPRVRPPAPERAPAYV
jgi:hypothetical protein